MLCTPGYNLRSFLDLDITDKYSVFKGYNLFLNMTMEGRESDRDLVVFSRMHGGVRLLAANHVSMMSRSVTLGNLNSYLWVAPILQVLRNNKGSANLRYCY